MNIPKYLETLDSPRPYDLTVSVNMILQGCHFQTQLAKLKPTYSASSYSKSTCLWFHSFYLLTNQGASEWFHVECHALPRKCENNNTIKLFISSVLICIWLQHISLKGIRFKHFNYFNYRIYYFGKICV